MPAYNHNTAADTVRLRFTGATAAGSSDILYCTSQWTAQNARPDFAMTLPCASTAPCPPLSGHNTAQHRPHAPVPHTQSILAAYYIV